MKKEPFVIVGFAGVGIAIILVVILFAVFLPFGDLRFEPTDIEVMIGGSQKEKKHEYKSEYIIYLYNLRAKLNYTQKVIPYSIEYENPGFT